MTALAVTALALAASLGLTACSGGAASTPSSSAAAGPALPTAPAPAPAPQRLSETGSSLMAPLFTQAWAPAYHAQFSQVTLSPASTSSGTGILSAAAGTTDIGASDA